MKRNLPGTLRKRHGTTIWSWLTTSRFFSYDRLVKLQLFFLSKPWLQRLFFSRQIKRLKKLAGKFPAGQIPDIILGNLMVNTGTRWRSSALKQPDFFHKYIDIRGIQVLEKAIGQHRGIIIVVTHSVARRLLRRIIQSCSPLEIVSIGGVDSSWGKDYTTAFSAQQIVDALKVLRQGGIVQIAGDGLFGKVFLNLPLFGHLFPFRTGFADLAIRTGAVALALFDHLDLDGRILCEYVEIPQPTSASREIQVEELVRNYAQILVDRGASFLSSMRWNKIRQISAMPLLVEASSAREE